MPHVWRIKIEALPGKRFSNTIGIGCRSAPDIRAPFLESCQCLSSFLFLFPADNTKALLEWQILDRTGEFVREVLPPSRCALITDSHVGPLYADVVTRSLEEAGFTPTVITVPAGEESKSMARAEAVCDQMIEAGLDRGAFVVALGGGVIGDLAGFVASIYYRGIPHVQIPTTVVAQVDSAIGGKTGVNAREGKNLIGSFHQPVQVITDPAVLASLPDREFNEGVAEIIKHAVIRDAAMLDESAGDA